MCHWIVMNILLLNQLKCYKFGNVVALRINVRTTQNLTSNQVYSAGLSGLPQMLYDQTKTMRASGILQSMHIGGDEFAVFTDTNVNKDFMFSFTFIYLI